MMMAEHAVQAENASVGALKRSRNGGAQSRANEPTASAAISLQERFEHVLESNKRLQETLAATQVKLRKATVEALQNTNRHPNSPTTRAYIRELLDENHQLLSRYRELERRVTLENVRLLRKSTSGQAKVRLPRKNASAQTSESEENTSCAGDASRPGATDTTAEKWQVPPLVRELIDKLKTKLGALEVDLARLRQENELLRTRKDGSTSQENTGDQGNCGNTVTSRIMDDVSLTQRERQELEELVQDRSRQLTLLEAKFIQLESKAKSKSTLYKQTLARMEQLSEELFDARNKLAEQAHFLDHCADQKLQIESVQKELHVLRSENIKLNETITTLSSRPFDQISLDLQHKQIYIGQLEAEIGQLQEELERARSDLKVVKKLNISLRTRVSNLNKEMLKEAAAKTRALCESEEHKLEREISELKVRFYTTENEKPLMEAFGKALKEVQTRKRNETTAQATPFLDAVPANERTVIAQKEASCSCEIGLPSQRRIRRLERMRLEKVDELAKLMQQELNAQLSSMKLIHAKEISSLRKQNREWQQRADQYLNQIQQLQLDRGALLQHDRMAQLENSQAIESASHESKKNTETSVAVPPSLTNVLEIVFETLLFSNCDCSQSSGQLFLLCDFYDYETQISPIVSFHRTSSQNEVTIDFGITFKFYQTRDFFQSPAARVVRIELHSIETGTTRLIAIAHVSLETLYCSPNGSISMAAKLEDPSSHAAVVVLRLRQLLRTPVDDIFKAIKRQEPPSLAVATQVVGNFTEIPNNDDAIIEVCIISALITRRCVEAANSVPLHVSYRVLGFPPVVIPVSESLFPPVAGYHFVPMNQKRAFQVSSTPHFFAYLRDCSLHFDLKASEMAHSALGTATASFAKALATSPTPVVMTLNMLDQQSQRVAARISIQVTISGYPTRELLGIPQQFRDLLMGVVESSVPGKVRWSAVTKALALPPEDRLIRQMLLDRVKDNTSFTPRSLCDWPSTFNQLQYPFAVINDLDRFFLHAGLQMNRSELATIIGALHQSVSSTSSPTESTGAELPAHVRHSVWERFILICKTSCTAWMNVETRVLVASLSASKSRVNKHDDDDLITWDQAWQRITQHLNHKRM